MTYRELYSEGCSVLSAAGIEEAALDARLLLEYICHTSRNDLLAHGDRELSGTESDQYREVIARRAERIPLQHITGEQDFMGLSFLVNESVLIPRQDTEILVEEVLKELRDGMRVLDLCTGSGCILLSLLHYTNDCTGVGADISEAALRVAAENGRRLLGEECSKHVDFLQSDLFSGVTGKFDIIVSNPPYIEAAVIETLQPEVRDHEPRLALDGSADGLRFYRDITAQAGAYLMHGGWLYFEIGSDQAQAVSALMEQAGFGEITVVQDYAGLDRVVYGIYLR